MLSMQRDCTLHAYIINRYRAHFHLHPPNQMRYSARASFWYAPMTEAVAALKQTRPPTHSHPPTHAPFNSRMRYSAKASFWYAPMTEAVVASGASVILSLGMFKAWSTPPPPPPPPPHSPPPPLPGAWGCSSPDTCAWSARMKLRSVCRNAALHTPAHGQHE